MSGGEVQGAEDPAEVPVFDGARPTGVRAACPVLGTVDTDHGWMLGVFSNVFLVGFTIVCKTTALKTTSTAVCSNTKGKSAARL